MRARIWTFITYPESLPDNFKEIIEGDTDPQFDLALVPFVMSPCHDMDIADNGKGYNGTKFKKPHYHNMVMFSQVKSYKQVIEMIKPLGASHVSQVHSTQSMVRYFTHEDHKDKAPYKREDIKVFNGADLDNLWQVNDREINSILSEMINMIEDNDITEFHSMVQLCLIPEYFEKFFPLVSGKYQFFILNYIKSKHFARKPSEKQHKTNTD